VNEREVHGPVAVWGCLVCHDPKAKPSPYATPVRVLDLCYGCHTDQRDYFFSAKYQHGPTSTGRCTICHNPHGSPNPYWLKRVPWDLCTSCHFEKATGRHVIAWGPGGDTHPTRGRPDPMRPERELACNSCHNPHAANSQYLWNFDARQHTELCQTCHRK
jgi:predicted CXXCH cytochrome family protein